MPDAWTSQRVVELAPDAASLKAGQGLARPGKWGLLGRSERVVWGEITGSGSKPYQVRIDLAEVAYKCSCPSRKFPCKHSLGLLLVLADSPESVPSGDPPAWVAEWLAGRSQRQEQKAEKAARKSEEIKDPEAQAKRMASREAKMKAGLEELSAWLCDLVRQGLASSQTQPGSFWENMAARLVDAQAPGMARQVRLLAEAAVSGEGWQERLLVAVGRLHLAVQAYLRQDSLTEDERADVRALAGWTVSREELLKRPAVHDTWHVLGQVIEEEDRLRSMRTWLWGEHERRFAMVLQFSAGGQAFETSFAVGTAIEAQVVFYPGAARMRAMLKEPPGAASPITALLESCPIDESLAACAQGLARAPWIERFPMALRDVVPIPGGDGSGASRWQIRDGAGQELPLHPRFKTPWHVTAVGGGRPVGLFGEWDGEYLSPMSVAAGGRFFVVVRTDEKVMLARVA